jgi:hypothetical protein
MLRCIKYYKETNVKYEYRRLLSWGYGHEGYITEANGTINEQESSVVTV